MAAAAESPAWKTAIGDVFGFVLVVWSIPLAIIVIGAPIVLLARLVIAGAGWLL